MFNSKAVKNHIFTAFFISLIPCVSIVSCVTCKVILYVIFVCQKKQTDKELHTWQKKHR